VSFVSSLSYVADLCCVARRVEWEDNLIDEFPWDAPLETETDFAYPNHEESGANIFSVHHLV